MSYICNAIVLIVQQYRTQRPQQVTYTALLLHKTAALVILDGVLSWFWCSSPAYKFDLWVNAQNGI